MSVQPFVSIYHKAAHKIKVLSLRFTLSTITSGRRLALRLVQIAVNSAGLLYVCCQIVQKYWVNMKVISKYRFKPWTFTSFFTLNFILGCWYFSILLKSIEFPRMDLPSPWDIKEFNFVGVSIYSKEEERPAFETLWFYFK